MGISGSFRSRWSSYILEEQWSGLDPEVKRAVKEALTDVLGCAVAGVGAEVASIARALPFRMRGAGNRTVIFSLEKNGVLPAPRG